MCIMYIKMNLEDYSKDFVGLLKKTVNFKIATAPKTVFQKTPYIIYIIQLCIVVLICWGLYKLYCRSLYHKAYFVRQGRETFQNNDGSAKVVAKNDDVFSLQQDEKYVEKKGIQLFDDFYADFYDDIVYDVEKNRYELENIVEVTGLYKEDKRKKKILDVGSGSGHHTNLYLKNGYDVVGLEASKSMIERAKENYPKVNIVHGDALNPHIFPTETFTHIQALYFTLYYMKDKEQFFENCYNWLKPGGYFIVHIVDRANFDPIVNTANPLLMVSPQKYAKKRIMDSVIQFKGISYKAKFDMQKEKDYAEFQETFKDDNNGKVRKNIHTFYMPNHKVIEDMILSKGFTLKAKIDMVHCQYEYQYLNVYYK